MKLPTPRRPPPITQQNISDKWPMLARYMPRPPPKKRLKK